MSPNHRFRLKDLSAGGALPIGLVLPHPPPADAERSSGGIQVVAPPRLDAPWSRP